MSDYWTDRALPVLRALEAPTDPYFADTRILSLRHRRPEGALDLALSDDAVYDTILQLDDAGYVEYHEISREGGGGAHIIGLRVSGRGLQVLGEWPRFELLISPLTFAALIEALADYATDEEATWMRQAADTVKGVGITAFRSLALGTGGQLARNALGLP